MLIEQLVSPNLPLNPEGDWGPIILPDGYDIEAQKRVELAVESLNGMGKRAFPSLIASSNDSRYCRTYSDAIEQDFTVGETCLEILGAQIDRSRGRYGYKGMPDYSISVIGKDPNGWWRAHSEMSIQAMRVEALQWTIAEETRLMEERDESFFRFAGKSRSEWADACIVPLKKLLLEEQKRQAEAEAVDGEKLAD